MQDYCKVVGPSVDVGTEALQPILKSIINQYHGLFKERVGGGVRGEEGGGGNGEFDEVQSKLRSSGLNPVTKSLNF